MDTQLTLEPTPNSNHAWVIEGLAQFKRYHVRPPIPNTFFASQIDARAEYEKRQQGKELLNLVVIGEYLSYSVSGVFCVEAVRLAFTV